MNRDRFSVATFNLYNLQLPGTPLNPGQRIGRRRSTPRSSSGSARSCRVWMPTSSACRSSGTETPWPTFSRRRGSIRRTSSSLRRPTASSIICAALVRHGLRVGDPVWVDRFPDAMRLQSTSPMDPQAPTSTSTCRVLPSRAAFSIRAARRPPGHRGLRRASQVEAPHPHRPRGLVPADPATYKAARDALGSALVHDPAHGRGDGAAGAAHRGHEGHRHPGHRARRPQRRQHSNTLNILTEQPRYLVGESQRRGRHRALHGADPAGVPRHAGRLLHPRARDLRESLDHVLVSEQFYDHSKRRIWLFDGLTINNDHLNSDEHRPTDPETTAS